MCFVIPQRQEKALKAEKDTPVRKLVRPLTQNCFPSDAVIPGKYISWHRGFTYEDGYEYTNNSFSRGINSYLRGVATSQGLHSFSPGKKLNPRFGQIVIKCYIPKGAYYFRDKRRGEYFSNKLVVEGRAK